MQNPFTLLREAQLLCWPPLPTFNTRVQSVLFSTEDLKDHEAVNLGANLF